MVTNRIQSRFRARRPTESWDSGWPLPVARLRHLRGGRYANCAFECLRWSRVWSAIAVVVCQEAGSRRIWCLWPSAF